LENSINQKRRFSATIIAVFIIVSLVTGSMIGYVTSSSNYSANVSNLNSQVSSLQTQLASLQSTASTTTLVNTDSSDESVTLSELYASVQNSVVVVQGLTVSNTMFGRLTYSSVQGSGFVCDYSGQMVIITNNHVIEDVINITVTFINGNTYTAEVLGADPYADLAVLSVDAPANEFYPLEIVSSSILSVGESLVAVGAPYGLSGTMTTGIVSALNRTITEDMSGSYPIAAVIQTSTPINSGNSGGPLMTYDGKVVGITTAIVSNSDGLGFAIPSDTILREISSLITTGSYNNHPTISAYGTDMTYQIAQTMNTDVTYGWLITKVTSGGPADIATLQGGTKQTTIAGDSVIVGGDIIVALNGYRIRNIDDLSTYLEQNTLPGQTIAFTIIRNNQRMDLSLTLGTRLV
jgi:S1-C subfamily serine protease